MFVTPNMALLSALFFYTGIELTFWSGVYGPAIGSTLAFGGEAKSLGRPFKICPSLPGSLKAISSNPLKGCAKNTF